MNESVVRDVDACDGGQGDVTQLRCDAQLRIAMLDGVDQPGDSVRWEQVTQKATMLKCMHSLHMGQLTVVQMPVDHHRLRWEDAAVCDVATQRCCSRSSILLLLSLAVRMTF